MYIVVGIDLMVGVDTKNRNGIQFLCLRNLHSDKHNPIKAHQNGNAIIIPFPY